MKFSKLMNIVLVVFLTASSVLSEPLQTQKLLLKLNQNFQHEIEPYKLYEVYVPLSSLEAEESYWIRAYFSGAVRGKHSYINIHL